MQEDEVEEFMRRQIVGRVGCHVDGLTYVVPVIFAWEARCVNVYSTEGQKVTMMRRNQRVCFEVDEYKPSGGWRSVIIQGVYEELMGDDAAATLQLLADRLASPSRKTSDQSRRGEGGVPVAFRIHAEEVTGRKVIRPLA
jgi:nitroimidazol reductase NimA-like FMN-containing flavoprotein (pyridoxamine 5'-phosphate oxidase superfamily)